jgi:hypothetical protein
MPDTAVQGRAFMKRPEKMFPISGLMNANYLLQYMARGNMKQMYQKCGWKIKSVRIFNFYC